MLPPLLRERVSQALRDTLGARSRIESVQDRGGGHGVRSALVLGSGRNRSFLKWIEGRDDRFLAEGHGLQAIAETRTLRVPAVLAMGEEPAFLLIEWIERGSATQDFAERFARGLAAMHLAGTDTRFGFASNNRLGATLQENEWMDRWTDFWRERRLLPQLELARRNGFGDTEALRACEALLGRLEEVLAAPTERPALLHGDLWSGNYLADATGAPVVLDPAAYYGQREAEFGMITLFGDLDARFYAAYNEAAPFAPGADRRIAMYRLYHVLNHVNLFGGSAYLSMAADIAETLNR